MEILGSKTLIVIPLVKVSRKYVIILNESCLAFLPFLMLTACLLIFSGPVKYKFRNFF